jgi:hypothetical protein
MGSASVKLVTIIAGEETKDRLVADLRALGARGYTVSIVTGAGIHGRRPESSVDSSNVKIEVLCGPAVAAKILDHLEVHYLPDEALTAYAMPVDAIPADKLVFPRRPAADRPSRKRAT